MIRSWLIQLVLFHVFPLVFLLSQGKAEDWAFQGLLLTFRERSPSQQQHCSFAIAGDASCREQLNADIFCHQRGNISDTD